MKITIAAGHNRVPNKGAVGILDEDKCTRETAKILNDILLNRGHEVYDVTPYDRVFKSLAEALAAESSAVNRIMPQLHICIHYNASGSNAQGTEVLVYSTKSDAYPIARKVLDSIVKTLGTRNRGIKVRPELHVLRVTKCPTILTEGLFIDNAEDVKRYDPYKIAKAIADAVVGEGKDIMKTPILGKNVLTANAMVKLLLSKNKNPKISCTALQLAELFLKEGEKEGIRGDIAFCQAMHETGNFNYGGQVLPEQNNYAGIGAVNPTPGQSIPRGATFNTPQDGVRAQIHHLKAYASKEPPKNTIMSPRYHIVGQVHGFGSAPNWEDLAGKWAVPGYNTSKFKSLAEAFTHGETYGQTILKIYDQAHKLLPEIVVSEKDNPSAWAKEAWEWGKEIKVTDGTNPKGPVTREQVVQMLYNYQK